MVKPKDTIIDNEWGERNELRGAWGSRPKAEPQFEVIDPDAEPEPDLEIERPAQRRSEGFGQEDILISHPQPSATERPPFDPDPAPEPEPDSFAEKEDAIENSKVKEFAGMLLSGSILSRKEARKIYPYLAVLAFLALVYISSLFRMQQLHRREIELTRQVKELRATSLELASQRMKYTRQSHVLLELQNRGIPLKELTEPPKIVEK